MAGGKIYFRGTFLFIYINEADKNKLGQVQIFMLNFL
jgi:hypothetical protein